jgi:hypothetical protein
VSSDPSDPSDTSVSRCGCPDVPLSVGIPILLPRIRSLLPLSRLRQVGDDLWGRPGRREAEGGGWGKVKKGRGRGRGRGRGAGTCAGMGGV